MAQANAPSMNVTLDSVSRTGLPIARPVRPFAIASANMTSAVTASQAIPSSDSAGRMSAATVTIACPAM